LADLVTKLKK